MIVHISGASGMPRGTLRAVADPDDLARALGQAIRIARVRRGWSQDRLGELAGTDGPHVSQIERGLRNPALSTLTRLAKALDLTLPQLLEAAQEEQVRLRQHGDPQT